MSILVPDSTSRLRVFAQSITRTRAAVCRRLNCSTEIDTHRVHAASSRLRACHPAFVRPTRASAPWRHAVDSPYSSCCVHTYELLYRNKHPPSASRVFTSSSSRSRRKRRRHGGTQSMLSTPHTRTAVCRRMKCSTETDTRRMNVASSCLQAGQRTFALPTLQNQSVVLAAASGARCSIAL